MRVRREGAERPAGRPATLSDVARVAGVAVSTASRALSNPDRVNAATRSRIERAAEQLHYVPHSSVAHSAPRAVTTGRTRTVAVVVPDITNPFYFDLIRGTQRQLRAAGHTQVLVDTEESGPVEAELLTTLRRSCDGIILAASRLPDAQLVALSRTLTLVTVNRPIPDVSGLVIDTAQGVVQAVEHLVSLGHRHLVYVSGPTPSWSNGRRWSAIQHATSRLGVRATRTEPFAPTTRSGPAAADAALNTRASAAVAFNDLVAIGMLERLRQRGVGVPDDFSVVGCDDIFGADFCRPPLTTVTAPIEQAGRVAVSLLLAGGGGPAVVLPTHLTIRATTAPRPTA